MQNRILKSEWNKVGSKTWQYSFDTLLAGCSLSSIEMYKNHKSGFIPNNMNTVEIFIVVAGWISEASKSYNASFFLAGCILLASALILMIQPLMIRVQRKNQDKKNASNIHELTKI